MSRLLERAVDGAGERLVLLAPADCRPAGFAHVEADPGLRSRLLHDMQRMRGQVYLEDGAILRSELSCDGRHRIEQDDQGWHLLALNRDGGVAACSWYLEHDHDAVTPGVLRARHTPLARLTAWRSRLWKALDSELARARQTGLHYAEVGGWAVSKEDPTVTDGLLLALAGYALARKRGGALGLTTATVRHCSSTILRRIGGRALEVDGVMLPSYYDPQYRCEMELLRFDSRAVTPRYEPVVTRLTQRLAHVLVVTDADPSRPLVETWRDSITTSRPLDAVA